MLWVSANYSLSISLGNSRDRQGKCRWDLRTAHWWIRARIGNRRTVRQLLTAIVNLKWTSKWVRIWAFLSVILTHVSCEMTTIAVVANRYPSEFCMIIILERTKIDNQCLPTVFHCVDFSSNASEKNEDTVWYLPSLSLLQSILTDLTVTTSWKWMQKTPSFKGNDISIIIDGYKRVRDQHELRQIVCNMCAVSPLPSFFGAQ